MDVHKMQRMASAFTFLEQYHKYCNEFLHHIVQVIGDETSVSFVNAEIKGQSKAVNAHTFTKQAKKV
jgi:hypothetical protein